MSRDRRADDAGEGCGSGSRDGLDGGTRPRKKLELRRSTRTATLEWTDASGAHREKITTATTVGQSPSADVRIDDPTVSRLHVELDPRDDGVHVRDLGSTNGTRVGSLRIERGVLGADATLSVGDSRLCVRLSDEAGEERLWPGEDYAGMVGASASMRALFQRIARIGERDETVLILGATGTGKELVARAVHEASARRRGPFAVLDCGALSAELLESELFGHARGAFSGSISTRHGVFESGDGGTVFLDEIGELPLAMQSRLLRVLQARTIRRVGENEYRPIDVRIVAATHRELRELVNRGAFREDLYFRLAVVPLRVPPLRDRRDDIPRIAAHYYARAGGGEIPVEIVDRLCAGAWLGNVRELRNVVERAAAIGWQEALASDEADRDMVRVETAATPPRQVPATDLRPYYEARERCCDEFERAYLAALLRMHVGNMSAAARHAGVDPSYLRKLRRKHSA